MAVYLEASLAVYLEHRIVSTILMYDFFTGVEGHLRRPFRCDFWTDAGGRVVSTF